MHRTQITIDSIRMESRQRTDYGDITSLAESLRTVGLIQPLVVNQDLRLIAGGRRLTAAKSLGWTQIDVVFRETLNEAELQELELVENVERHDLTWQEEVLAIAKIHTLKTQQADTAGTSWGHRETARLFNVSKTSITNALCIARELAASNPGVVASANAADAMRVILQQREDAAVKMLAQRQRATTATQLSVAVAPSTPGVDPLGLTGEFRFASPTGDDAPLPRESASALAKREAEKKVYLTSWFGNQDCLSHLPARFGDSNPVDAFICDPPYAIDIDYMDQAAGGVTNVDRIRDTHQVGSNLQLLTHFIPLAYRYLKSSGWLVMWCDAMRWQFLYDECEKAGFSVQRWPIVWVKESPCINQSAHKNFTKNVEFAIVARKGNAVLAKPSPTCVISAPNVDKLSSHPFAKPQVVWDFLARHILLDNSYVFDPFMGVGSSILAFLKLGHRVGGCEIDETHHAHALENVKEYYTNLIPGVTFL